MSRRPFFVPNLIGNAFSVSLLRMFTVCLLYMPFNHKWVLNFVESFFLHLLKLSYGFSFQFVKMVYHINWLAYIQESLHPGINSTWSWCMMFLLCSWILFAIIVWRIFVPMLSVILTCNLCVCVCVCDISVWFCHQCDCGRVECHNRGI